jgi:hypothetical protein
MRGEWHGVRWVEAKNDCGQEIPPFALVVVAGATLENPGRTVLLLDMPSRDNDYPLAVNSHKPIADGDYGLVAMEGPVYVAYDNTDTPAYGEEWGGTSGLLVASKDFAGLLILAAPDTEREIVLVEIARPGQYRPKIHFHLAEALTTSMSEATATIETEWGLGYPSPYTGEGAIIVKNMPNSVTPYTFEGASGNHGVATLSHGNIYITDNMECP